MKVMHSLGYSGGGDAISYDESYLLPPYLHVELHFDLVGQDQKTWYSITSIFGIRRFQHHTMSTG